MFIEEYPNLVAPELCEKIIEQFELDAGRTASKINTAGNYGTTGVVRTGTSLVCPLTGPWKPLIDAVIPALDAALNNYAASYPALRGVINQEGLHCTGPVIERIDPGQGFEWHSDQTSISWERVLTSLLYLKTVGAGGATEFLQQKRAIQPEVGKIALFPGSWTHLHRGVSPESESKYVMASFWVYDRNKVART